MSSDNMSQDDREIIGGMYLEDEQGNLVLAPPTEDKLSISLIGLYYELGWNSIDKATFQAWADNGNSVSRDDFRAIMCDSRPVDGQTKGDEFGMRVGTGNLVLSKYEAAKYPDCETRRVIKFPHQDIPIKETLSVNDGQYILFSIDEEVNHRSIEINDGEFDESKLDIYIERFRIGELYFDMLRMDYADQKGLTSWVNSYPHGLVAFVLDPSGIIHQMHVYDGD